MDIIETFKEKAGVPILISDKVEFRGKKIMRDSEGHHGWSKVSSPRRHNNLFFLNFFLDIAILSAYGSKNRATNYAKQELKEKNGQMHNYNWRLQHPSLNNCKTTRQKIYKNTEELNIINQEYLIKIDRELHSITVQYRFFKCPENIYQDNSYPGQ